MTEDAFWTQYVGRSWSHVALEVKNHHKGVIRVIYPGSMVTADYKIHRLNVTLNSDEIVTSIYFG